MTSSPNRIILFLGVLSVLFITSIDCSYAQSTEIQENSEEVETIESNTRREELQRYFGYEKVLYRYLTLPYDVSINTNQSGNYVDIGFIFIIFIPIILLLSLIHI